MKKIFGIVLAMVMLMGTGIPVMAAEPSITPSSIDEVIMPGDSFVVQKAVLTPVISPKPDILFLADTTGSMGPAIANVASNATNIMNTVLASAPDAQFGVANYKDYPYDPYVTLWQLQMTSNTGAVQSAINTWNATGGSDWPEGWFASLDRAVNPAAPGNPGWRSDSTKIIVLFGDAPAHDPVPMALTGLSYDISEASLTADLVAAGVKMVFVSLATTFPEGLNLDPTTGAIDYQAVVPGYIPGGTAGQATRIAAATGGVSLDAPTPEDVANQILAGLTSLPVTVSMTSNAVAPLSTTFSPASQVVTSGTVANFTETITIDANATGGTYTARDWALIDGAPMTDAAGNIIYETKTIRVPEGFLTGGGQINTGNKKDDYKISFAGNVGFLADFNLVGQWQTNFLNVSVDSIDGAKFHSTNITSLQFSNDGGAGPNPPPANANTANFTAMGRLNGEDGWTLNVLLADRGEPGKNDSIRLILTNPSSVVVYDSLTDFPSDATLATTRILASGNLQIHSDLK